MAAHHLLWSYLAVWIIQGGYCVWIAVQWKRTKTDPRLEDTPSSKSNDDF